MENIVFGEFSMSVINFFLHLLRFWSVDHYQWTNGKKTLLFIPNTDTYIHLGYFSFIFFWIVYSTSLAKMLDLYTFMCIDWKYVLKIGWCFDAQNNIYLFCHHLEYSILFRYLSLFPLRFFSLRFRFPFICSCPTSSI